MFILELYVCLSLSYLILMVIASRDKKYKPYLVKMHTALDDEINSFAPNTQKLLKFLKPLIIWATLAIMCLFWPIYIKKAFVKNKAKEIK